MNNQPNGDLILLRGLPGAGKTTIAKLISSTRDPKQASCFHVCTDQFFTWHNDGEFDPDLLDEAHKWTERQVRNSLSEKVDIIIVHNTFTQPWEWEEFKQLSETYNYRLHTLIVENRHGGESDSDVPQKTVDKMESRFQTRLQP